MLQYESVLFAEDHQKLQVIGKHVYLRNENLKMDMRITYRVTSYCCMLSFG